MNARAQNLPTVDRLMDVVGTLRDGLAGLALLCEESDEPLAPQHAAALMTMMMEYAEARVPEIAPA